MAPLSLIAQAPAGNSAASPADCAGQSASEGGFNLGCAYTLRDGTPVSEAFDQPTDLVNLIVPNLFVVAGVAILILIIVAGYKFVAKGAQGVQDAGKIAGGAIAGLIVMFAAYWIIQIIKQVTGADIPL